MILEKFVRKQIQEGILGNDKMNEENFICN